MNKKEFVNRYAEKHEMSKRQASEEVGRFLDTILDSVSTEEEINLTGYFKVKVKEVDEREGHNPQTQEKVIIPAHRQVRISVGNKLKQAVK